MLGFTRKTDYALVALARLAETRPGPGSTAVSARALAERDGVPAPILMNVLKDLVHGGLVTSTRGAQGGYALARPASGISVRDVLEAMEGRVRVTPCCGEDEATACQECNVFVHCPVTHSVRTLNDRIQEFLGGISLSDLVSGRLDAIGPVPGFVPVSRLSRRQAET
ncbi:MAG: RrF2 family transcriptional regulator [bacterium]